MINTSTHKEMHAHKEEWEPKSASAITASLVALTTAGKNMKRVLLVVGVLTLIGVIALIFKGVLYSGTDDQARWGYVAALMSFLLTVGSGAPMVAVAATLAKGQWIKQLQRISVLFSTVSVATTIVLLPLLFQLPPLVTEGARRRSVWFEAPDYSPHIWVVLTMLTLLIVGLSFLYSSALPDFAAMRDHSTGWRQRLGQRLARGWIGTDGQWRSLRLRIGMFGTLYFLVMVFAHFLISTDLNMSLVPGWRDAIYPMYHVVTAFQAGTAGVVLLAWVARRWFGAKEYILQDHFWALARLLFATTLMWFYFWFSGFIVFWYGRSASDMAFIDLLIRGPMIWAFVITIIFAFFTPWWWLIWNRVRNSVNGPAIGATLVLIGILFDRIRLYVPAWSVPPEQIHDRFLMQIPATVWPDIFDVLIIVGFIAFAVLLLLASTRALPIVSVWQAQEYNLLAKPVKYLRARGVLLAKPD